MKRCAKCGETKALDAFVKNARCKDGLHSYCKECVRIAGRASYAKSDPVAHRRRVAKWKAENLERVRELNRASHQRNKDKRNADSIAYRAANREHTRALCRQWAKDNPTKMRITNADRRARKKLAIPSWASDEFDRFVVQEAYELAKVRTNATGIEWHVDHIVPLRNKSVCGLHCAANIQVIPAVQNHIKGNREWPDM